MDHTAVAPARRAPRAGADPVPVARLVPRSGTHWPGRTSAVVLTQGCPWRCTHCVEAHLIDPRREARLRWAQVLRLLEDPRTDVEAVVFSGGEPTLHLGLADAMAQVRARGYAVGLLTAGPWPLRLNAVLPLVDWVGLDVKATEAGYAGLAGTAGAGAAAWKSLELLVASGVDHEVRTTVLPGTHSRADVLAIAERVAAAGARAHVLQADARAADPFGMLADGDLPGLPRRA